MVYGYETIELCAKSQITLQTNSKIKVQKSKLQIKMQKFKTKLFYDGFNILNFNIVILIFDF